MFESTSRPGEARERCRVLRSKWMFIDVEPDPTIPSMESGSYWCVHTQNCLGPDGKAVDEYECNPSRECYRSL